jgi:hypothetical protein
VEERVRVDILRLTYSLTLVATQVRTPSAFASRDDRDGGVDDVETFSYADRERARYASLRIRFDNQGHARPRSALAAVGTPTVGGWAITLFLFARRKCQRVGAPSVQSALVKFGVTPVTCARM